MVQFNLGNDIAFAGGRQRRGINTSGGINPNEEFEKRFAQQQNPFGEEFGGGNISRLLRGQQRGQDGRFNFGGFTNQQLELGRATAFNQLFNTEISGQQADAVAAVQKNRVARGLRGRAAEAAARQAQERFVSGNRREALRFITEDFSRNNPAFQKFQAGQAGDEELGALDFIAQSRAVQLLSQFRGLQRDSDNAANNQPGRIQSAEQQARLLQEQQSAATRGQGDGSVLNFAREQRAFAGAEQDKTSTSAFQSSEQFDLASDAIRRANFSNNEIFGGSFGLEQGGESFNRIREAGGEQVGTLLDQLVGSVKSKLIDGKIGGRDDVDAFADIFGVDDKLFRDTFQKSVQQVTPFGGRGITTQIDRPNLFGGRTDRTAGDLDDRIAFTEQAIRRQQDQVTRQQGNIFLAGTELDDKRKAQSNIDLLQSQLSKFQAQRRDLGLIQNTLFSPLI